MTSWSMAMVCRQLRTRLISASGLLLASISASATVEASNSEVRQASVEWQIAAYHSSPTTPLFRTPPDIREEEVKGRIAEARRILMELQAFIVETARAVELDKRLKVRKIENDRLKDMLSSSRAAKKISESNAHPIEGTLSALTGIIVRNWLESTELDFRSAEVERELIESEKSWSDIESRVAALRQALNARRAKLRALQTESAVLSNELKRMRLQVTRANAEASLLEQQQGHIVAATEALRRNVTFELRRALLENGH